MKKAIFIALATNILFSCSVGDDYKKPKFKYVENWKNEKQISDKSKVSVGKNNKTEKTSNFLKSFNDEILNKLLEEAKNNNFDIKIAESRILESRAGRKSIFANFFPKIDGSVGARKSNLGFLTRGSGIEFYESSFDASWEIDVFGGNRRRLEASNANILATQISKDDVIITLQAEVARNYTEVRSFQKQISIAKKNIENQQKILDLITQQNNAGIVSNLNVQQSKALLETTKASLPQLETSLEAAKNRLNVLLGKQPGEIDEMLTKASKIPVASSKIVLDTPLKSIENRPDIKIAEQDMIAKNALTGAAFSEFFPKITLSGNYGSQNTNLSSASDVSGYGIKALTPLLHFGAIRAQVDIADAKKQQSYLNYENTILKSLEEVNNNLVAYLNEEKRRASLEKALNANKKTVGLSQSLYKQGVTNYVDVLNSEKLLYDSELSLAQSEALVTKNLIALYKSIGGESKTQ
jgi:NodT family efflux transporter outer membrane factor (OMF) lipoprotein